MSVEAYIVDPGPGTDEFRLGDTIIIDWSKTPRSGTLGGHRVGDARARLGLRTPENAGDSWGRIIRPADFLK